LISGALEKLANDGHIHDSALLKFHAIFDESFNQNLQSLQQCTVNK